MVRLLLISFASLGLLSQSTGFAQFADKYVRQSAGPTEYVAGSSSMVIEEANFRVILSPAGSTLVDLSIEKLPDTPIELRLRDDARYTLFSHRSRTDAPLFVRRLDLKELDNGAYWLDIQVGKNHLTRKMRLVSVSNTEQMVLLDE